MPACCRHTCAWSWSRTWWTHLGASPLKSVGGTAWTTWRPDAWGRPHLSERAYRPCPQCTTLSTGFGSPAASSLPPRRCAQWCCRAAACPGYFWLLDTLCRVLLLRSNKFPDIVQMAVVKLTYSRQVCPLWDKDSLLRTFPLCWNIWQWLVFRHRPRKTQRRPESWRRWGDDRRLISKENWAWWSQEEAWKAAVLKVVAKLEHVEMWKMGLTRVQFVYPTSLPVAEINVNMFCDSSRWTPFKC